MKTRYPLTIIVALIGAAALSACAAEHVKPATKTPTHSGYPCRKGENFENPNATKRIRWNDISVEAPINESWEAMYPNGDWGMYDSHMIGMDFGTPRWTTELPANEVGNCRSSRDFSLEWAEHRSEKQALEYIESENKTYRRTKYSEPQKITVGKRYALLVKVTGPGKDEQRYTPRYERTFLYIFGTPIAGDAILYHSKEAADALTPDVVEQQMIDIASTIRFER